MSDQPTVLGTALDLVVFAPLGFILTVGEEIPKLAAKGRARVGGRLTTARIVGEFAVTQGRREAERRWGASARPSPRPSASRPSPPPSPPRPATSSSGPDPAAASSSDTGISSVATAPAPVLRRPDFRRPDFARCDWSGRRGRARRLRPGRSGWRRP